MIEPSSRLREVVVLAMFGGLWGLAEISLGSLLHGLNIPFTGAIMGAVASLIFLTGRRLVPRRGGILYMGAIAALLKLFSIGAVRMPPMVAILSQALLGEAVITVLGLSCATCIAAGAVATFYSFAHKFISNYITYGNEGFRIFFDDVNHVIAWLGLPAGAFYWMLGLYGLVYALTGAVAGAVAWKLGREVKP